VDTFCYLGGMLNVHGDADASVESRHQIRWNKIRQLVPLILRGRLYSSCMRKEDEMALQQAEMRMTRWMGGIKLQDRVPSKGL